MSKLNYVLISILLTGSLLFGKFSFSGDHINNTISNTDELRFLGADNLINLQLCSLLLNLQAIDCNIPNSVRL